MIDIYRAVRQFERMLPGVAHQEHLRATDPERYRQHMRSRTPTQVDPENSRLIAIIVYDPEDQTVRFERAKQAV